MQHGLFGPGTRPERSAREVKETQNARQLKDASERAHPNKITLDELQKR